MIDPILMIVFAISVVNLIPASICIFLNKKGLIYVFSALEVLFAVLMMLLSYRVSW